MLAALLVTGAGLLPIQGEPPGCHFVYGDGRGPFLTVEASGGISAMVSAEAGRDAFDMLATGVPEEERSAPLGIGGGSHVWTFGPDLAFANVTPGPTGASARSLADAGACVIEAYASTDGVALTGSLSVDLSTAAMFGHSASTGTRHGGGHFDSATASVMLDMTPTASVSFRVADDCASSVLALLSVELASGAGCSLLGPTPVLFQWSLVDVAAGASVFSGTVNLNAPISYPYSVSSLGPLAAGKDFRLNVFFTALGEFASSVEPDMPAEFLGCAPAVEFLVEVLHAGPIP